MKVKPLGEFVVVEFLKIEEKTSGGIYLVKDDSTYIRAKVLAVGTSDKIEIKPGDIAYIPKDARSMKISHSTHVFSYSSILAIETE
jgi:co-chaperonin GroES (HSP10)